MMAPRLVALFFALFALASCKGSSTPAKFDVDADPLALLPASPVVVVSLDARAATTSASLGPAAAAIVDGLQPLGADAAFVPSRDVDRVVVGLYLAGTAFDWVAILGGRFDPARLAAATQSKSGAPIAQGTIGSFQTRTIGSTIFVPLTQKTLVAGSGEGVRRLVDRLEQSSSARMIPPWMSDTLATPSARLVAVGDFQAAPVAAATLGTLDLPWIQHMQVARVIANFDPPGINAAATLTYPNETEAASATDGLRSAATWVRTLGPLLGGVTLQGFTASTEGANVRAAFALDDGTIRALVALAQRYLPSLHP